MNPVNPADCGMVWLNQYAQAQEHSMIIDESTTIYPTMGMSVMDDIGLQTSTSTMVSHFKSENMLILFFKPKKKQTHICFGI